MTAVAPQAPGRLGVPIDPSQALRYLQALKEWLVTRRKELDALDAAIVASPHRAQLTRDMMLSMALWKACSDRYELLLVTFDSGRVGPAEQERLSSLIWGRLDATLDPSLVARAAGQRDPKAADSAGSGFAVSLPEACRLSDAMCGQLRTRLALEPDADRMAGRIKALRAQIDRLRDQVALEPASRQAEPRAQLDSLITRTEAITQRHSRGGDVGGLIGPVEIEAATMERDLIKGGVLRREAIGLSARAREQRADLEAREAALRQLVRRTVDSVAPAPKYAVPDVSALGEVPDTKPDLDTYLDRLAQVSQAMQVVQDAYSQALYERERVTARLTGQQDRARTLGVAEDADLTAITTLAQRVLERRPTPLPLVKSLLEAHEVCIDWLQIRTGTQPPAPTAADSTPGATAADSTPGASAAADTAAAANAANAAEAAEATEPAETPEAAEPIISAKQFSQRSTES
ncbi:hypothetical protein [Granulicoccus phenolivorans]|uniref:hypothetical protein n=1 Tax=Granulicoccus phenolivorans TaxID=266854 RepID=UPI000411128E|nr:hypothetical protein [Granulicoccus phenolivorans]